MLSEDRWLLPEGIDEVLPAEARRLERLRRKVMDLFASWGYQQVIPPFIEYIESLLTGAGHDLDLQTFKLIDQISGRLMGVRADMTPQVARIDARNSSDDLPARLCYLGTVLHTQSDHLEKSRSPLQIGAELYGHAGNASDLEVIRLVLEMLAIAGLKDVYLDLGHVGIYRGLAKQAGLDPQQEADLFEILQRKARPELLDFLKTNRADGISADMLGALIELNGGSEVIDEARQRLGTADEGVKKALFDLEKIAGKLNQSHPSLPIHFDLAELRGYHYKTGVVFAAYVPGYGREIARGGRYDDIGKVFGRARPATGFSADLKVLARLADATLDNAPEPQTIFAPAGDEADLHEAIRSLRTSGRIVIQELVDQQGGAAAMGCRHQLCKQGQSWEVVPVTE
ncbi:MAG TPA: ATP phosphoribosyltransferase regulatory subunit [Methylococcaceae bacterium]|nr:ATP phosphoribosyltransferase regulatory subunit [Methylococcaceae bacterium]